MIRASLGATPARLLRQLLTEGMFIALLGGAIGLTCGSWLVHGFGGLFNDTVYFSLPRRNEIGIDWRLSAFTAVASVICAMLFSAGPAWRALKVGAFAGLRDRRESRLRAVLLALEIGFSLALVTTTGLLVQSYRHLRTEKLGFSDERVLTATVALPPAKYPSAVQQAEFFRRVVAGADTLPGAQAAATVRFLPLSGVASVEHLSIPDRLTAQVPPAFHHVVTPGYFATYRDTHLNQGARSMKMIQREERGLPFSARRPLEHTFRTVVFRSAAPFAYMTGRTQIGRWSELSATFGI